MDDTLLAKLADQLDQAIINKKTIPQISAAYPNITLKQSYEIQKQGIALRQKRGEKIVGYKMGLTSPEKRAQMHVNAPIYGTLTNVMQIKSNAVCKLDQLIQPKIEAEVAFILKKELKGKVTLEQVLSASSGVCAAMDIIDSRFQNFKFTLSDVIADNCSAGRFVLSEQVHDPMKVDVSKLKIELIINDKVVEVGTSQDISGNPAHSVMMLAHLLFDEENAGIPAGSIILCGSAVNAVTLSANMVVKNKIEKLGDALVKVE
ncbi:MAG TPA: fumarylacetoacetate hydrolase family protein [Coxiellaceae bacterium]|nr:MAG: hypothetical protein A3E81_01225 [Gammaproteobacteria bacterium RIFCSPHIGHO2_12_FULL_36_30]HLB56782.1 fumarylacetoacetate hydrolase family protein [Coxiellaceae bacterium]